MSTTRTPQPGGDTGGASLGQVQLVSTAGDGLVVGLSQGINGVGRQPRDNYLVLVSPAVSRFHARIEVSATGVTVSDVGSANGTFVNGERIRTRRLKPGDTVGFSEVFTFRVELVPDPRPPVAAVETREEKLSLPPPMSMEDLVKGPGAGQPPAPVRAAPPAAGKSTGPVYGGSWSQPAQTVGVEDDDILEVGLEEEPTAEVQLPSDEDEPVYSGLETLEGEGHQLAAMLELAEQAQEVTSTSDLDKLVVRVLEELLICHNGFVTYRLPDGSWKLLMVARPERWERRQVRDLLNLGLKGGEPVFVSDSRADGRLGPPHQLEGDARLLFPLQGEGGRLGVIFVVTPEPQLFEPRLVRLLEHFSTITCQAPQRLGS